ncbi:spermatogenesis-associated protein 31E1-like [Talpa occidentalis]|uniref:spermatogenesis-associated protein 31E1-like n=1 Tax=Talpa occidentalis TaxID=50954 RepID=UPI00188F4646|nr:spermatogenesis-associated protein 31E1-like [Talpa occidentalis]
MENYLLSLKSVVACGLCSYYSGWVTDTIMAIVYGVWLFFLLVPCPQCMLAKPPPPRKRNSRKCHKQLKRSDRSRKKHRALKACRDCLQVLQEVRVLISLLYSHLRRHPEKCSSHQSLGQDPPGKVWEDAPAGVLQHPRKCVEDATPAVSLSASPISLTSTNAPGPMFSSPTITSLSSLSVSETPEPSPLECPSLQPPTFLPQPSVPPELEAWPPSLKAASGCPHPDTTLTCPQCDSKALPMGTARYSPPRTPWLPSVRTLSGVGRSTHPISSESWGQTTAKDLRLSASSQPKSRPEPLSNPSQKDSFQGDTRNPWVETGSPPFSPDIQELLKILINKQVELKLRKEKEEIKVSRQSPIWGSTPNPIFTSRKSWSPMFLNQDREIRAAAGS